MPTAHWHYVKSKQNPADIVSRGCNAVELKDCKLWWNGPLYLSETKSSWPTSLDYIISQDEIKKASQSIIVHATTRSFVLKESQNPYSWEPVNKYSSLSKVLRITAYSLRFLARIITKLKESRSLRALQVWQMEIKRSTNPLEISASELERSRIFLIHLHQNKNFNEVKESLQKDNLLSKHSSLIKLNPFLHQGLIRVTGRLGNSLLPFESKYPLLLYPDDKITQWLIQVAHNTTLHGGPLKTQGFLRMRYWIIKGRDAIKNLIRKCINCRRWSRRNCQQIMGDLPQSRTILSECFQTSGVDYAGPIKLRLSKSRGNTTTKGYIAIFVCFASHAVDIQLVEDYSSPAFVAAFERFSAKRGHCKDLYSDRGTTFVGADKELKALFNDVQQNSSQIFRDLSKSGTHWHFNPPGAPHFGGLWEAAVKSVKYHLVRTIGDQILTYVELLTLLAKIEAVLNSRPLTAMSDDINDLEVLTPSLLLTGRSSFLVPEPDCTSEKIPLASRYRRATQVMQHVWNRWSREYITALHQRNKWQRPLPSLKVGDLVIVKDESTPPGVWPKARVMDVHPGSDNRVRVATVKTATTTLKRPIVKLIHLPVL